eukprot:gene24320-30642_t
MAAVTHCNLRMVKRLLLWRHVDVTLKDRAGLTVLDMANKLPHNPTSVVTVRRTDYDSDWSDLGDDEGVDSDMDDERGENEQYLREKEGELNETETREKKLPGRAVCSNTRTRFAMGSTDNNRNNYTTYQDEGTNNTDNYSTPHSDDDENDTDFNNTNADFDLTLTGEVSDHDSDGEDDERLPRFDVSTGVGKVIRPCVLPDSKDTQTGALHTVHDSESLRELWDEDSAPVNADETGGSVDDHKDKNSRVKEMRARTGMLFGSNPREFLENGLPKYGAELSDDDCDVMSHFVEDGEEYLTECARKEGYVSSNRVEELDTEEASEEVKMDTSGSGEHGGYKVMGSAPKRGFVGVTSRMPDKSTIAYDSELDNSDSD